MAGRDHSKDGPGTPIATPAAVTMRPSSLPVLLSLAAGTAGPALDAAVAHAAPPPSTDVSVLPASTLVLRAAADASGVYAYTLDEARGERSLVHRESDGSLRVLARSPHIEQMALDATRVTWVGEDGVQAVPKAGGDVVTLAGRDASLMMGNPEPAPWAVALDGDDVFFSLDDGVGRVPKGGGEAQLLAGGKGATLVGVDAGEVFWLEPERDATWDLIATPRRGGAARRIEAGLPRVLAAVLDETAVDWMGATDRPSTGTVHRTQKDTGADRTIAEEVPTYYDRALAQDGAAVYWLEYPDGLHGPMRVRAALEAGGPAVTLAEPFPVANKLFVDDQRIYWAQQGVHAIARPGP
jgi:hypothetical protein